jgi:hypothetical protein
MILRRLTDAFRRQDWFTVAVETLIVVLGVFLGLQVNNWNSDRQARSAERGTLMRLYEDLAESHAGQARDIAFLEQQLADQALILKSLDACAVTPDDDLAFQRGISELGYINPPRIYRRTVDELASAGRTDLIRNAALAERLARIVALVEWRGQGFDQTVSAAQHYRYLVEENVRHQISRTVPDPFIPNHRGGVDYDISLLCRDPAIASAVSAVSYLTSERLEAYRPILQEYEDFMPLIAAELTARWRVDVDTVMGRP